MKKQAISQNDPYNFDPVTGESGDTNTYNVNCKTTMSLRFKELYYQVPEEQEFSFSVPLEGFILGEPSDGMREVIKQLDEEIDEQKELGNKWLTVIETIEFLCQIAKFANDINAVLQAIKSVSYWVLLVVKNSYPAASAGAVSTWISMCTVLDEINYVFTEFFWPTATLPVPPKVGHLFKWLCLYMECKLAEPNTYAMLLGEGISLGINAAAKEMYSNKEGNKLDEQTYVEEQTSSVSATDTLEGTSVTYSQIQEPGVYGCTESSCSSLTNVGSESSGMGSNVGIHASEDSAVILYKDKAVEVDLSTQKTGTMKVTTYSSEKLSDKTSGYWGVFSDAGSSPGSTAQFMPPNVNGIIGRETKTGIGLGGYIMWDEDALGMSNTPNKVVDEAKYKAWTTQNVDDLKKNLDEAWLDGSAFNPYKIEALDWACPRAARLAALKTQQIKCAQKLCYFNAIKYGTNPELCDTAYAIHKCLYVDGAITYAVDIWDAWWASLGKQMLYNLIYQAILNLPVQLACYPYYTPGGVGADQYCMQPMETGGAMSAICGTTMTVLSIMEAGYALSSMNDDEYWNWWKTIETGANYCEQAKNAAEEMNI
jgi:hypothetical protein